MIRDTELIIVDVEEIIKLSFIKNNIIFYPNVDKKL
jgi:hypothetical protein